MIKKVILISKSYFVVHVCSNGAHNFNTTTKMDSDIRRLYKLCKLFEIIYNITCVSPLLCVYVILSVCVCAAGRGLWYLPNHHDTCFLQSRQPAQDMKLVQPPRHCWTFQSPSWLQLCAQLNVFFETCFVMSGNLGKCLRKSASHSFATSNSVSSSLLFLDSCHHQPCTVLDSLTVRHCITSTFQ